MSNKIGKRDVHFQPSILATLVCVALICASFFVFYWCTWCAPLEGGWWVLCVVLSVLLVLFTCFSAGMRLIYEFYSKGVLATPEEMKMTLPGEDLIKDPDGKKLTRFRQARDLDAPLEEVWKHVYQMDPTKGGMYAWSNCERLFGMNVDNAYVLEDMWQQPDSVAPGDFWAWSYAGFGAEVADVVPNKYIVWYSNSENPVRTPGASNMLTPGKRRISWYWTVALTPLDGGKRCRIISGWDIAYAPHSLFNRYLEMFIIGYGGAMMTRRCFRNLELSALHLRKKSIPLRIQAAFLGRSWDYDPRLHDRIAYPDLRWAREFPRVEAHRAPITEDPNWPPAPGTDYVPPIEQNNAKKGWMPEKAQINNEKAKQKEQALLKELGY